MKSGNKKRGFWGWVKRIFIYLFVFQFVYIILLKWIDPPITITQLTNAFSHGLKRDYVDFDEMSYNAKLAVIAAEDQIFAEHGGFDWKSIEKAMKNNEKKKARIRGGSTISQQVAKNVFLWQGRDYIRKGLEVYFTQMIEWIWGKERILEMYLNVIEMGPGIFGIEAASQAYFKRPAFKLSRRQAAMIAAVFPSPKRYSATKPGPYVRARINWISNQMNALRGDSMINAVIR